jgi:hypothetical protein
MILKTEIMPTAYSVTSYFTYVILNYAGGGGSSHTIYNIVYCIL